MAERVRIQPQAVDVPADDPFRNDLLDRKEFIEAFSATLEGIQGPAVIEQPDSTVLIPPSFRVEVDSLGRLNMTRKKTSRTKRRR